MRLLLKFLKSQWIYCNFRCSWSRYRLHPVLSCIYTYLRRTNYTRRRFKFLFGSDFLYHWYLLCVTVRFIKMYLFISNNFITLSNVYFSWIAYTLNPLLLFRIHVPCTSWCTWYPWHVLYTSCLNVRVVWCFKRWLEHYSA